jgi:hypothetical protein
MARAAADHTEELLRSEHHESSDRKRQQWRIPT